MKKYLKLSPEFMCYPIWVEVEQDNFFQPINHYELNISAELKEKIENWDNRYQSIYIDDCPQDSKFQTAAAEKEVIKIGYEIKKELQQEMGNDYEILYRP